MDLEKIAFSRRGCQAISLCGRLTTAVLALAMVVLSVVVGIMIVVAVPAFLIFRPGKVLWVRGLKLIEYWGYVIEHKRRVLCYVVRFVLQQMRGNAVPRYLMSGPRVWVQMLWRGLTHDLSKFRHDEAGRMAAGLGTMRASKYGSDEYRASLLAVYPSIRRHWERNRHHPEHFFSLCSCVGKTCGPDSPLVEHPSSVQKRADAKCGTCAGKGVVGGVYDMQDVDLVEMAADWMAASEMTKGGSITRSLLVNRQRFGYGRLLENVLATITRAMSC